jgi:hypothetical protein
MSELINLLKEVGIKINILPGNLVFYKEELCYVQKQANMKGYYVLVKLNDENVERVVAKEDEIVPIINEIHLIAILARIANILKSQKEQIMKILPGEVYFNLSHNIKIKDENDIKDLWTLGVMSGDEKILSYSDASLIKLVVLLLTFIKSKGVANV